MRLPALLACLLLATASFAQTDAGTPSTTTTPTPKKKSKTPTSKTTSKKKKGKKAPAAETPKPPESKPAETPPAAPAPAQPPPPQQEAAKPAPVEPEVPTVPGDEDPPAIVHTPVAKATRNKPLEITAHITDPSGVFQPVFYVRRHGLGANDWVGIKMTKSKTVDGDYTVELAPLLVSADLDYYLEAYDYAGNGPARAGTPDKPLTIKVEDEKKIIVAPKAEPTPPTTVTVKPKGAPPAITHSAVAAAKKGQALEINARLVGETGVSDAKVMWRHVGEKDFRALPMGNIGGDEWSATIPAGQTTSDIEYYVEASDKYGNGPGRSGAPNAPYVAKVAEPPPPPPALKPQPPAPPPGPRIVKAPFSPNPGRSAGWLLMAGFVGAGVFAGGEALGAWQANNAYEHAYTYDGVLRPDLLDKANAYSHRAKVAGIVAGASLLTSIVLLVVFPEHPDTIVVGSGGDVGVRF